DGEASTEPHSCECGEVVRSMRGFIRPDASTEPHSCECGEVAGVAVTWGTIVASTEPHSCECGEIGTIAEAAHKRGMASTEPHSCECGERTSLSLMTSETSRLQRSRTRVSAESSRGACS